MADAVDEHFDFVGADFHAVISSSYLQFFNELLESSSLSPSRSMSLANRRLQSGRPIMDTDGQIFSAYLIYAHRPRIRTRTNLLSQAGKRLG